MNYEKNTSGVCAHVVLQMSVEFVVGVVTVNEPKECCKPSKQNETKIMKFFSALSAFFVFDISFSHFRTLCYVTRALEEIYFK